MTMLDFLMRPELVDAGVGLLQERPDQETKYKPLIRPDDKPAIWLNKEMMEKYRPEMKKYYYDPTNTRPTSSSSASSIR